MDWAPSGSAGPSAAAIETSGVAAAAAAASGRPAAATPVFRSGSHKSCDICKTRKVKCKLSRALRQLSAPKGTMPFWQQEVTKHLRYYQTRTGTVQATASSSLSPAAVAATAGTQVDARERTTSSSPSSSPRAVNGVNDENDEPSASASVNLLPQLYVDHLLDQAQAHAHGRGQARGGEDAPFEKGNGIFGGGYSLTFFSESRLLSLSTRLRNNKVNELVRRINSIINGRLRRSTEASAGHVGVATTASVAGGAAAAMAAGATTGPDMVPLTGAASSAADPNPVLPVDPQFAATCIQCYFERAHPLYPFLDRAAFEARARPILTGGHSIAHPPRLARSLARSKAWASLYYAVLAIGCLHTEGGTLGGELVLNNGGGGDDGSSTVAGGDGGNGGAANSFEPGKGSAWRLFSRALANLAELLILPDSLLTLQALTAMAVYGLGVACLSIERVILAEAARRAQSLAASSGSSGGSSTSSSSSSSSPCSSATFRRTFWVLYSIEKVMSFHFGRSSAFVDSDIACPFPASIDDDDLGYFLLCVRYARLLSRTYAALFSVGVAGPTTADRLAAVDELWAELEAWRRSIPDVRGLRPVGDGGAGGNGENVPSGVSEETAGPRERSRHAAPHPNERPIALGLGYLYHSLVLILARAKLHHVGVMATKTTAATTTATNTSAAAAAAAAAAEDAIVAAARAILARTPDVDVAPYTPLWVLAVVPLTALLVLFDIIVHDPTRPDTGRHLALLDMGAGYFSRIEYASGSTLPGSLIAEFAHIARDYVRDYHTGAAAAGAAAGRNGGVGGSSPAPYRVPQEQQQQRPLQALQQQPLPPPPPSPSSSLPTPLLPPAQPVSSPVLPVAAETTSPPLPLELNTATSLPAVGWAPPVPPTTGNGLTGGLVPLPRFGDNLGYGYGYSYGEYGGYNDNNSNTNNDNTNNNNGLHSGSGQANGHGFVSDLSGTDVMGLFTGGYYFLPELDVMLYNGI
ncbi:fungal specific transcription factor domain containing protein [Niveomyces insectorum RCEF 264]|uniref:Fungal specific transcription factor domain containing protein n=1 Tax=Niveomyces insectorum RCEF 264 TaxID=1081102 RepID=A0A167SRA9_9HYPO|nr:fungal specific transcription factor domain containing protein [Niveomyces insectorum RCEF 264]